MVSIRSLTAAVALALSAALGTDASAQSKPSLAIFERWGLIGAWMPDCRAENTVLPGSIQNWRIINAANPDGSDSIVSTTFLDGKAVFRSVLSAPSTAPNGDLIALYSEGPNGTRIIVTTETADGGRRHRTRHSHTEDKPDQPFIRNSRFVSDNTETQWFERCGPAKLSSARKTSTNGN